MLLPYPRWHEYKGLMVIMPRRTALGTLALVFMALMPFPALGQVTETPTTMDPGSVQMRVDALSLGIKPDTSAPNQFKAVGVGWALVSAGLTKTVDVELGAQLFVHDTYQYQGLNQTHSGVGDVSFRSKWTFWSDPTLEQSAAVIPYVQVPTNSGGVGNGRIQGGLIVPWAMTVTPGLTGGAMLEWDQLRNAADTRYESRFYASGVLRLEVAQTLSAYSEATVSVSTAGSSTYSGLLGGGATLALSKTFQWDFEIGKVIGHSTSAWQETLRFTWRLF